LRKPVQHAGVLTTVWGRLPQLQIGQSGHCRSGFCVYDFRSSLDDRFGTVQDFNIHGTGQEVGA
jgi:hypothetical protein